MNKTQSTSSTEDKELDVISKRIDRVEKIQKRITQMIKSLLKK